MISMHNSTVQDDLYTANRYTLVRMLVYDCPNGWAKSFVAYRITCSLFNEKNGVKTFSSERFVLGIARMEKRDLP